VNGPVLSVSDVTELSHPIAASCTACIPVYTTTNDFVMDATLRGGGC